MVRGAPADLSKNPTPTSNRSRRTLVCHQEGKKHTTIAFEANHGFYCHWKSCNPMRGGNWSVHPRITFCCVWFFLIIIYLFGKSGGGGQGERDLALTDDPFFWTHLSDRPLRRSAAARRLVQLLPAAQPPWWDDPVAGSGRLFPNENSKTVQKLKNNERWPFEE